MVFRFGGGFKGEMGGRVDLIKILYLLKIKKTTRSIKRISQVDTATHEKIVEKVMVHGSSCVSVSDNASLCEFNNIFL